MPVVAALYYGLAIGSLTLTQNSDGIASFWPGSGLFVAALLLSRQSLHASILLTVAIGSVMANLQAGSTVQEALVYSAANCIEALIVSRFACKSDGSLGSMDDPRSVVRFFGGALAGGFVSAAIATMFSGNLSVHFFQSWFGTVVLGILIVTPAIVMIANAANRISVRPAKREIFWAGLALTAVTAITLAVFSQNQYPLLFVIPLCVIGATYRLGAPAAAASVVMIALSGTWATAMGDGPINLMAGTTQAKNLFFQFFLLSLLCAAWPLSALLAQKHRLFGELANSKKRLEQAERAANIAHWYYEIGSKNLHWSDELFRIYGMSLDEEPLPNRRAILRYHPDDRDMILQTLITALRQQSEYHFEARIIRPGGEIRYVTSSGEPDFDAHGEVIGIFGMVKDITERVGAIKSLKEARSVAEQQAKIATHLSETDLLTNIANRRKVVGFLQQAIVTAEKTGEPLSIGILDVDHFKSINDRFGHQAGDHVLEAIAATSTSFLRASDCVGRLGGEEFLFVLPGTTSEVAMAIAERVRAGIMNLDWAQAELEQVTACVGIAQYVEGADEMWLMQAADEALYEAKKAGRNRLRLAA
ncbi:diguanylate cyclase [Pontixanthobacter gangjinensis]